MIIFLSEIQKEHLSLLNQHSIQGQYQDNSYLILNDHETLRFH